MTPETQHALARGYATGIFGGHAAPCLSLYLPTHRHHPENKQDPIRFGDLVKSLVQSLVQNRWSLDARALLEPLRALASDASFWSHTADGVAAFVAEGFFRVYTQPRTVHELAVVADSFHTDPLARLLRTVARFQVLGLSLHELKLFEGNRDALDEIELAPGVPRTMPGALGVQLPNGTRPSPPTAVWAAARRPCVTGMAGHRTKPIPMPSVSSGPSTSPSSDTTRGRRNCR